MKLTSTIACALLLTLASCGGRGDSVADKNISVSAVADASDYVGEYTRNDGTPIYITKLDSGLVAVVTGNTFALKPEGSDRFDLVGVSETVLFERELSTTFMAIRTTDRSTPSWFRRTASWSWRSTLRASTKSSLTTCGRRRRA